ncbi:GNAT family N-acetyltransferase [Leifsonia sp. NPDC077715]|uniref:GNAT family N-acetyltransferase n=1 Tax=Leifsonia sp. NPDC077715 TaxID=3155539 RepID=UPI00341925F0
MWWSSLRRRPMSLRSRRWCARHTSRTWRASDGSPARCSRTTPPWSPTGALVARREGVVGLLVSSVHPDHVLVENVAVAAAERGTGLGARLLAIADDQARAHGLGEVRLYTHETMTENLAYYPRRGFVETGRRTENGFSRVFFTRIVPPQV